jgi:6-phosphogluconate dehydrogenase
MTRQDKKYHENIVDNTAVESFVRSLDEPHRMLIVLKSQLYGGSWGPMLEDLQNRLEGKPYIFKLANRIKDDVQRIHRLQEFEKEHNVDLADFVKLDL